MRLPVEITVTNKKLNYRDMCAADDTPEPRESARNYSGYMVVRGKKIRLNYFEFYDDGAFSNTSVMLENGFALISQRGEVNTNLVFRQGESCDCVCQNDYGNLNLRVNTERLKSDICSLGGKLKIDYTIEIMGNLTEKNSICLSVCPAESVS